MQFPEAKNEGYLPTVKNTKKKGGEGSNGRVRREEEKACVAQRQIGGEG